jgi:hypothetical protein
MPRPTKDEKNPLCKLRVLIGGEPPKPPITQVRLSKICGIPVPTIRKVEIGKRTFTRAIQRKIRETTGARWDPKGQLWVVPHLEWHWSSDSHRLQRWVGDVDGPMSGTATAIPQLIPCTTGQIKAHREAMKQIGERAPESDRNAVKARIDVLFDQIPDSRWFSLLAKLQNSLEDIQQEFRRSFKDRHRVAQVFMETDHPFLAQNQMKDG